MAEYIKRESMTCEDCAHYGVCYHIEHYGRDIETDEPCEKFKPAADVVEVKHGEWIEVKPYCIFECSNCEYEWYLTNLKEHPLLNDANYCPNCGADMRCERRCEE